MEKLRKKILLFVLVSILTVTGFVITMPTQSNAEEMEEGTFDSIPYYRDGNWLYFINDDGTATVSGYYKDENTVIPDTMTIVTAVNGRTVTSIDGRLGMHPLVAGPAYGLIPVGVKNVIVPDDFTSIGEETFYNCSSLKNVTLPNGLTEIGKYAFMDCPSLESITLPDSITTIDDQAFYRCTSLTDIDLPNQLSFIGNSVFYGCTNLKRLSISSDVTTIKSYFTNCNEKLMIMIKANPNIIIQNNVVTHHFQVCKDSGYCDYVFYKVNENGDKIVYAEKNSEHEKWAVENGYEVTDDFEDEMQIDDSRWEYTVLDDDTICVTGYKDITTKIKKCNVPNTIDGKTVTKIGGFLISNLKNVEYITLPDTITVIDECAFAGLEKLKSITIPQNVTSIGQDVIRGCTSLTQVKVSNKNETYNDGNGSNGIFDTKSKTLLMGCSTTTIPDDINYIGDYAFYMCSSLSEITIPNNIKLIGEGAFENCNGLKNVVIQEGVVSIGDGCFADCEELISITIPKTVTEIGENAFENSDKLKIITTEKGSYAEMWALNNGYSVNIIGENGSDNKMTDKPAETPAETPADKPAETPTDKPADTSKDNSAKTPTDTKTDGSNNDQTTNNQNNTDNSSTNQTNQSTQSVTLAVVGTKLTSTEKKATFIVKSSDVANPTVSFTGTTDKKATSVNVPDTVTIDNVTYTVTGIADKALSGNKKITKMTVGKNVTSIGKNAFQNCKNLKTITIKTASLKSIGKNALKGINKKAVIKVPKKQLKAYKKLFSSKTGYKKTMKIKAK